MFKKHLSVENRREWVFWESDGTFPSIPYYIRIASTALFMCQKGYIDLEINLKTYRLSVGKVVVLLPEHILCIKEISPDYSGCGLLVSEGFWKEARRDVEKMNPYYTSARELPCIPVTSGQSALLTSYMAIFKDKYQSLQTTNNLIIVRKLFTVLLYEVYQLYVGVMDQLPPVGKKEKMLQEFLRLLAIHFKEQREIRFYADWFQMSPRYFSSIIKESSRQSAAEWIDNYVVAEAGILLRTTTLSIKEISDELNFSDQSFFGKYFKHHTGMSPKQYRAFYAKL